MDNREHPEIITENIRFDGQGGALGGYLARPGEGGEHPAVIVIHDINGITDYTKTVVQDLAREGFVSLSVNLVSRSLGPDFPGGSDEVKEALRTLSDADALSDLEAGVDYLKAEPVVFTNSIGCMGFCMGGRFSLLLASQRKDLKAAVAFYGSPITREISPKYQKSAIDLVPELTVPLLGNYGEADAIIPVEDVRKYEEELRRHNKVFDIKIYPEAKHAFHKEGPNYNAAAAKDGWERALSWFAKYLRM